jgi:hypothetical protein
MENGITSIDIAQDFKRLFPQSEEFVSYYQGSMGYGHADPTWTSHVGLYGRYIFSVTFDIEFDWTRKFPRRVGDPSFHLMEISSITRLPDGRLQTEYSESHIISSHDWKILKEANGDFSAIGYQMDRDHKLEGFEEAWR